MLNSCFTTHHYLNLTVWTLHHPCYIIPLLLLVTFVVIQLFKLLASLVSHSTSLTFDTSALIIEQYASLVLHYCLTAHITSVLIWLLEHLASLVLHYCLSVYHYKCLNITAKTSSITSITLPLHWFSLSASSYCLNIMHYHCYIEPGAYLVWYRHVTSHFKYLTSDI